MELHIVIDILALVLAGFTNHLFRKKYQLSKPAALPEVHQYSYQLVLIIGLVIGSIFFGTLNTHLSGIAGFSKSLIGGIAGAILFAEIFKKIMGIKGSTGFYFIAGLCVLIIVGRIGCFIAGLPDYTFGIPTNSFLGFDFGDGIMRHPVQLYESFAMLVFLSFLLASYKKYQSFWLQNGFYLFVLFYAGQRFIWEFLKPYATVISQFNLFHIVAALMVAYAVFMLLTSPTQSKDIQKHA
jgi:prolipoprotein diacylglyceryltransferase